MKTLLALVAVGEAATGLVLGSFCRVNQPTRAPSLLRSPPLSVANYLVQANLVTASGDFSAASLGKFLDPTRASTCELLDALGKASERFIDVLQYLGFCALRT